MTSKKFNQGDTLRDVQRLLDANYYEMEDNLRNTATKRLHNVQGAIKRKAVHSTKENESELNRHVTNCLSGLVVVILVAAYLIFG